MAGGTEQDIDTLGIRGWALMWRTFRPSNCLPGSEIVFTFYWLQAQSWEGKDFSVVVEG